jgi:putative intracellular protease/amidase
VSQEVNQQLNEEDVDLKGKKILLILPHYGFRDKEVTWLVERFEPKGIVTEIGSTHLSEAQGRFGTLVQPHVLIGFVEAGDYDGFIFIGEEAASEFYGNEHIQRIIENAFATRKLVAAIGAAVPILTYTGKLVGKKVTSLDNEQSRLEELGCYFTGRLVEQDGDVITANGPYATREFAESILKALRWSVGSGSGRQYLR